MKKPVVTNPIPELTERQFLAFRYKIDDSEPDSCWEWRGSRIGGYGCFGLRPKGNFAPHRIAFKLANGVDPVGFDVAHSCDNPPCCNPAHLFKATRLENIQDRDVKGRRIAVKGASHKLSKLSEADVLQIRQFHASGNHCLSISANKYGVTISLVSRILKRKCWQHI